MKKMEDSENENEEKRTKSRSPSPDIKSTAVVKYTAFPSPVGYAQLQCNTDLNLPPSNWGAAIASYGLQQILTQGTGLSSFRMAHMFPDCVGEVDVISGAECIKKLLKLPYQPNGTVSMMVHRVENTLLLDDFDVYDYLMKSEWSWLKDFFYENILKTMSEQERMKLTLSPALSSTLQLTHNFLSHSVTQNEEVELPKPQPLPASSTPMSIAGPFLPEPEIKEKPEKPPTEHLYNRNVLWTFEDIHMLIGSDMPIFGDKDRPCVSLRLRDARDPINDLTGIDCWLDNLMCNVPEVLMCYHIDGIVQQYEPIKTEDLPNMENSKFSPKIVRNVVQNIMSFLKSNATKSGHTYWLFKGPRDEAVKLYDLTSLCPDNLDNTFTTPVAMLLYRVARKMRMTNKSKHVKELLEQVIKLLKVERYPQIIASCHYMLADLYVPATTNPENPNFNGESTESDDENECSEYETPNDENICDQSENVDKTVDSEDQNATRSQGNDEKSLAVQIALKDIGDKVRDNTRGPKRSNPDSDSMGKSLPDRCGKALHHALLGLLALHNITINKRKEEERERIRQQIINKGQHPKIANPYEPIKMSNEPISQTKTNSKEHTSRSKCRKRERRPSEKKNNHLIESNSNIDKNGIQIDIEKKVYPTLHEPNRDDKFAWKLHLKTLLYKNICLAYATLAEYSYAESHYGFSLKYIDIASRCQKLLCNMIIKSNVVDASCLIGRVGDNYFQMSKNWHCLEKYKNQFQMDHDLDSKIRLEIENDLVEEVENITVNDFDLDISFPTSEISAMLCSCALYSRAADVAADRRAELLRRRASVCNELAVRYMNDGQQIYAKYLEELAQQDPKAELSLKQFQAMSRKSLECLDEAIDIYKQVNDIPKLVQLFCNKGKYLRLKADRDQAAFRERRRLYNEAEELYNSALKLLGTKKTCGATSDWELVEWELSCLQAAKAFLIMQESPEGCSDVSRVAAALNNALKRCLLGPGPRQHLYQHNAAVIHQRLGRLYHSQYRVTHQEGSRRPTLLNEIKSNYKQAADLFASLENPGMFLTVQIEHVAVLETQAAVTPNVKLKSFQAAVQLLRQSYSAIKLFKDKETNKNMQIDLRVLTLYEDKMNFMLKSIIKYCRGKSNKDYENIAVLYKKLYCASLKIKKHNDIKTYATSICDVLLSMDQIHKEFE